MGATQMAVTIERRALFGLADARLAERLNRETERFAGFGRATIASDLAELRRQSAAFSPRVILLEEEILAGAPLLESLRQLSETAPLVLIAGVARQVEIERLVAEGDVDFIARAGDFAGLGQAWWSAGCDGRRVRKLRSARRGPVFRPRQRKYSATKSIIYSQGFWGTRSWYFRIVLACRLLMRNVCRWWSISRYGCAKPREG